jgi:hypothetical protein
MVRFKSIARVDLGYGHEFRLGVRVRAKVVLGLGLS